ncbi:EF-hand calcium-binding domain-containing protein 8-like isoform X6 [Manis pentadactyla]|uniref:EF-hand calcium-binding domain-containing protein 8-like isoform X6 n=1 Tax=Manis pentadactyla TaxID=143292 RepID=UPI00255D0B25|nr:EF-hand calcium-binding domain-containing protein 8-like isoform X6 [Manis pentadactyla]
MVGRVGDWSPPSLSRSAGACGWRRYPQKEIRSKPVSSKELKENPQPKAECKEVLSSRTPSVILSQKSDFQEESQLFAQLHLAEMEKVFEEDTHSPAEAGQKFCHIQGEGITEALNTTR